MPSSYNGLKIGANREIPVLEGFLGCFIGCEMKNVVVGEGLKVFIYTG